MEATTLSVGKSVVDGALDYAKSALAGEVALQLGIQRDHAFIRDELEMMQAFLMVAHEERDQHKVLMTWVKQVRDVAYDAEDYLQDFSIHLKQPSCWRLPRTLRERRRIATKMKELRARVEDVSQRNLRYQLIKRSSSGPSTAAQMSSSTASTIFGIDESRNAAKQDKLKGDLVDLICKEGEDLRVIAAWGTNGDLGLSSIINAAYENPDIKRKFSCRAWVRVMNPFNPNDFIHSLVKQFRSAEGVDVLLETDKTGHDLAQEFSGYVNEKSYLVVLNELSTFEDWKVIKTCLPNNKKGSRIVVCAQQVEVASLCAGQESQQVLELKQLSSDQTIYAFYTKDSREEQTKLAMTKSISNKATNEISVNQSKGGNGTKLITGAFSRIKTMVRVLEESQIIGRVNEKSHMIELISNHLSEEVLVISVWGMGGLGKTALIKDVYQNQNLIGMFEKRACVTVMRPFILEELLERLIEQLNVETPEKKGPTGFCSGGRKKISMMGRDTLLEELGRHLQGKKCLIVLDDLSTTAEWDQMVPWFAKLESTSRIVVTTREESIAKHCSRKHGKIYQLKVLGYEDAFNLFTKKVFKEAINLDNHPELNEEAKLILKKCNGLPLAIVTIGGFLANQPKTAMEWKKLNEHISAELEVNPELEAIRTILGKSYDGLPYHLKSCFLYLAIFPEDHKVIRRRLVRRWAAEGYSREIRGKSAEKVADSYFMELISRSMILPSQESIHSRKQIDSCQVHDLMHEISISKSAEENLVFRLEEGCSSSARGTIRHLAISNNWNGGRIEFENIVNPCNLRSLTVFGKWRSFFISDKMRMLRVLDLEGTRGLVDHHLEHIGNLLHLKYLSLRSCDICYLPHSLGNLRQLETLDIKHTDIIKLPNAIIRLMKLQYLRAGGHGVFDGESYDQAVMDLPKLMQNRICMLTLVWAACCVACCAPRIVEEADLWTTDGAGNRRDVCTGWCCSVFPSVAKRLDPHGVLVPRGLNKLAALHTLGTVNIGRGKATLQNIRKLTRLRKLGVIGVNVGNMEEFCSTLSTLSNLESLSVRSVDEPGLVGFLEFDGLYSPPENLRSLKLEGNLVRLPGWVNGLQKLVKLSLKSSMISEQDTAMQILGNLPNLALLRLQERSFQGDGLRFTFLAGAFPTLMVVELFHIDGLESVEFAEEAMPKLELLSVGGNVKAFSGLSSLKSLKEVLLEGSNKEHIAKDVQDQLERNQNKPILKSIG